MSKSAEDPAGKTQTLSTVGKEGESASADSPSLCLCGCGRSLEFHRKGAKYFESNCRRRIQPRVQRRACQLCGADYQPTKRNQKYCTSTCRSRDRLASRPFVSLDGEGTQRDYILLASSTGKAIHRKRGGLSTQECLDFLLSLPKGASGGTRPIYVWFAFDYDVNMILRDIPLKGENSCEQLKQTNSIYWNGYKITYLRRKILRISDGKKTHTSYDIWGFFQASFEKALVDWNIEVPAIITEGKASRSNFAQWPMQKIIDYNNAELVQLAQLAENLRAATDPLNLPIQSWHGPAALAGSWLRKNKVKEWKEENLDPAFLEVCTRAYFGGRIDVLGYGFVEPVYHYDIVSAYPAAIATLPNLQKLTWKHRQGKPRGNIYVAKVAWNTPVEKWPPLPWRSKNGTILYPPEGEGWYWFSEVESAIEKFGNKIKIKECWEAEGELEYPFTNLITETFQYRRKLKAEGSASHIPVKLVLNSLYGKFAQTVGRASYYSPIWAGLITAHTRAQLQRAITDQTVCVMTDSIWSMEPLDLSLGSNLGEWEEQSEQRLILAEAGLYEGLSKDGTKHVWQRGFDKRNPVDINELVSNWIGKDPSYSPRYTVSRFIGMGLATVTSYPWRRWVEIPRTIEPVPLVGTTKRLPFYPSSSTGENGGDFIQLAPRPRNSVELSYPYSKLTFDQSIVTQRLEDECNDDSD